MKKIHFLWVTSSLVALFSAPANAQSMTAYPSGSLYYIPPQGYNSPYGYSANNGNNLQGDSSQSSQTDDSNNTDNDSSQKTTAPSNANVTPGWSVLPGYEKEKSDNADSNSKESSENTPSNAPKSEEQQEADRLKRIEKYREAQSGSHEQEKKKTPSEKTDKKDSSNENVEKDDYIVKGKATALDGISLSINGHQFQLKNLLAPGNGQQCFTHGMPWDCGEESRKNLQDIVDDQIVTCHVIKKQGICKTDTDGDVIQDVVESGYAIPSEKDGVLHKKENIEAKAFNRGLYQD